MYFYQNRVKSQITEENFWTLKFIWNCKRFRVARMTLRENKGRKRENKGRKLKLYDFKTYYKPMVIIKK